LFTGHQSKRERGGPQPGGKEKKTLEYGKKVPCNREKVKATTLGKKWGRGMGDIQESNKAQ